MDNNKLVNIIDDKYIYILMVTLILIFFTTKYYFIILTVLFLIGSYFFFFRIQNIKIPQISIVFILFIILILVQTFFNISIYFSINNAFEEVLRNFIYLFIIIIISNINISKKQFLKYWSFFFILFSVIAIFQFFKLFNVNYLLESFYSDSIHLVVSQKYSNLDLFRAGSVFLNPNSYTKFNLVYLSIFLNFKHLFDNKKTQYFISVFLILAFILTGSRTGLIIGVFVLLLYFFSLIIKKEIHVSHLKLYFSISSFITIPMLFLFYWEKISEFRLIKIFSGLSNSLLVKFNNLSSVIAEFNKINYLIGLGPYGYFTNFFNLAHVDSDFGYLISYYGLFGLVLFFIIIFSLLIYNINKDNVYFKLMLLLIFILFGFTGGIYFNFRIGSIFLLIFYTNFLDYDYTI